MPYSDPRDPRRLAIKGRYSRSKVGKLKRAQWQYGDSITEEMIEASGLCPICHRDRMLVIDHDHETGRIRGLICNNCNRAIGMLSDSPEVLLRAVEHLS